MAKPPTPARRLFIEGYGLRGGLINISLEPIQGRGQTMPTKEAIIATVKAHCRSENELDKAAWLSNFADNAVNEDPVGADVIFRGIEELSTTLWDQVVRAEPRLELVEELIVCGNEAIAILAVEFGQGDARLTISPIVAHFTFNKAGKIAGIRSFFNY
jgi:hypothetical protein